MTLRGKISPFGRNGKGKEGSKWEAERLEITTQLHPKQGTYFYTSPYAVSC
jgi:hypothetical protein